jgi:hypothetical protein
MSKNNLSFVPNHELEGIRNRAIKRAEGRVEEREHLRLEIKSRKLIEEMQEAAMMLFTGCELFTDEETGVAVLRPLGRDRIASLKAGADIADKLLKKVLPDLKQIELQDGGQSDSGRLLENTDISNRMRLYVEALQRRALANDATELAIEDAVIVEPEVDFLA